MSMRASLGRLAAAAVLLLATRTSFAGTSARLVYLREGGAEDCPTETAIRAAVQARLGYDPFFVWAHETIFVEVSRAAGAIHVQVKLVGEDNALRGTRELRVKEKNCASVLDAMALSISLAIDPNSVIGAASASAPEESAPPPEPAPAPPPPPSESPPAEALPARLESPALPLAAPEEAQVHVRIAASAMGWLGAASTANVGGIALVGARWRALSLDLEGRVDVPSTGRTEGLGIRVQSWILAASAVPCVHIGPLFGCGVLSLGSQTVTSVGAEIPQASHGRWAGAGGRAGVEIPVGKALAVRVYGDLLRDVTNRVVVNLGNTEVYAFPPISGGLGVGVAWQIR